ncbi:MAG TPA: DUF1566 domain-containing protein [Bdellovibrionales bacterium]|jgi:hypothetical protein|nr:DUF1566 domain-containing protein [Bdellovibrionales bacterium]
MKYLSIAIILIVFGPAVSWAQCPGSPPSGIDCVATTASKTITAHSQCRSVTNNHASGKAIMVPTGTSTEWASFYNNPPTGVTAVSCDPCSGKTVGQTCTGTTALFAGTYLGDSYMTMPSGCADSTSNPTCSGTDTVMKTWNDGTSAWYDIPGITNHAATAAPSSNSERGDYTTPLAAAITLSTEGGLHAAARFCNDMVYGGYSDWYLPSKSELAFIYCKSTPGSHNTLNPQENVNCGGSGPTNQLTGFAAGYYWASTERNSTTTAWVEDFGTGYQYNLTKNQIYYVRCIRRYTP